MRFNWRPCLLILTEQEENEFRLLAPWGEAKELQRLLADCSLILLRAARLRKEKTDRRTSSDEPGSTWGGALFD